MVRFRGQAMLAAQPQHGRLRRLLRVPGPGGHPSRPQDPHPHRLHRLRPCLARLPRWSVFEASLRNEAIAKTTEEVLLELDAAERRRADFYAIVDLA